MKKLLCSAAALLLCGLLVFAAGCGGETEADRVRDMLEALPSPEELPELPFEQQRQAYLDTQAAYDAYQALTDAERASLEGAEDLFDGLFSFFNSLIMPLETE